VDVVEPSDKRCSSLYGRSPRDRIGREANAGARRRAKKNGIVPHETMPLKKHHTLAGATTRVLKK
jgi:hypothetical protein